MHSHRHAYECVCLRKHFSSLHLESSVGLGCSVPGLGHRGECDSAGKKLPSHHYALAAHLGRPRSGQLVGLPACLFVTCLSTCTPLVCLNSCQSVGLPAFLFVTCLSTCTPLVCLNSCQSVGLPAFLFVTCLSTCTPLERLLFCMFKLAVFCHLVCLPSSCHLSQHLYTSWKALVLHVSTGSFLSFGLPAFLLSPVSAPVHLLKGSCFACLNWQLSVIWSACLPLVTCLITCLSTCTPLILHV